MGIVIKGKTYISRSHAFESILKENKQLEQQLKEAKKEIDDLYSGRLGACHTCEQVAELNIKLEQQIKECESVINKLIDKTEYGVNQWQQAFAPNEETEAQIAIRKAKEYLTEYKTNE